jgi:hypothetical protein
MTKVKHVVLLKFREGVGEEQINKFFDELLDVTEAVPGVDDYVSGANTSPEGHNQGFTHGVIMTFANAAARDAYLAHPEHLKFGLTASQVVEQAVVVDFEV